MPTGGSRLAVAVRALAPIAVLSVAAGLRVMPALAEPTSDELRDRVRELVRGSGLGDQLLGASAFAALPGISAASFKTEASDGSDAEIERLILPLARQLHSPRLLGAAPYLEATLGYSRTTQSGVFDRGGARETRIDELVTTLSVLAGAGLGYELLPGLTLRPLGLLGYAHLDNDTDFKVSFKVILLDKSQAKTPTTPNK